MSISIELLKKIEKPGDEICGIITANELTYEETLVLIEFLRRTVIGTLEKEKNKEEEENEKENEKGSC